MCAGPEPENAKHEPVVSGKLLWFCKRINLLYFYCITLNQQSRRVKCYRLSFIDE